VSSSVPGRATSDVAGLLDIAAHDLRSSLNGIRSWATLLESCVGDHPDPRVRRAIEGIHIGVDQQLGVIENLLEGEAARLALKVRAGAPGADPP
jgi:signal transduction histidine kinase